MKATDVNALVMEMIEPGEVAQVKTDAAGRMTVAVNTAPVVLATLKVLRAGGLIDLEDV